MRVLAIADDTTGAIEIGAKLAMAGAPTLVTTKTGLRADTEVLVVDAQTRRMSAREAHRHMVALARAAEAAGIEYLYKKTDSTLRGHIAAEFEALLEVFGDRPLLYVPAYPAMGRTVVQGELRVHGVPLRQTAFAKDALNPAQEGSIPALLAAGTARPVRVVPDPGALTGLLKSAPGGSILVCDGAADEDLTAAAAALAASGRRCLAAGTAGFCGPWALSLPAPKHPLEASVSVHRCLLVSGSRNPVSQAQIQRAAERGVPVIPMGGNPALDDGLARTAIAAFDRSPWVAAATSGMSADDVAGRIGALVRRVWDERPPEGLVVFGGDTTAGVLRGLGITDLTPRGEVMPGAPLSLLEDAGRSIVLVTKAGGFGGPDVIAELRRALEGGS